MTGTEAGIQAIVSCLLSVPSVWFLRMSLYVYSVFEK
jgi:hypothetical protein